MATQSSSSCPSRVVLFPVDESPNAERSFEWFVERNMKPGDKIIFYHQYELPSLKSISLKKGLNVPTEEWQEDLMKVREKVEKLQDKYVARAQGLKIPYEFHEESGSHPGESIVATAEKKHVSLIVMGTRGMGILRRTVLGSVSDYVIHHSKKPVCVVPPDV